MMFSWLTEKGILAMNPAREVKTERYSRTEGKTPAFVEGEVKTLLDAVDPSTHTGLRDRALLGVLAYTFARICAVVNLGHRDGTDQRFTFRRWSQIGHSVEIPPFYWSRFATATTVVLRLKYERADYDLRCQA
jgi:site-specific recombinase XerD